MYIFFINVKTLNRGENMKKFIMYSIYGICFVLMLTIVVAYNTTSKEDEYKAEVDYDYVEDIIESPIESVNIEQEDNKIIKPFNNDDVKIVKNYYDYKKDEKTQLNSITYYNDTYMQNSGICYSSGKPFEVVAVYDGEVTDVNTDELVGNSITIKHNDNSYSVYQSIKDIKVKKGDSIKRGTLLAYTNVSNINKDLNNHLYFELVINGNNVNPEEYYDSEL